MNTFLLLLGLTVIYYVVLFYFDNKRKKAFQLTKNNAIGNTAELPSIEEIKPENLFGKTDQLDNVANSAAPIPIAQKATAAKNVVYQHITKKVTEDLDELAIYMEANETIVLPKENIIESLQKAGEGKIIGEEEIAAFIHSPNLSVDRQELAED